MRWSDVPIHFIDFEGSSVSGVLEYGVATLQGGSVIGVRTRICGATGRIRPEDAAVHRLTPECVAGEAPFSSEFELFAGLRESGPLAAHFSGTENGLLKSVWPYPRSSPDFAHEGMAIAEWGPWVDSARVCAETATFSSLQLEALVDAWGLRAELDRQAAAHCPPQRRFFHAALYDALAGGLVLMAALSRPEQREMTVARLLQLSVAGGKKRRDLEQGTLF